MEVMVLGQQVGDRFAAYHADCMDAMLGMPDDSVHLTVTSIPFASLFTYSASDRDLGNCKTHAQFFAQFTYHVRELLRVTKPGRIAAIHLMNLPTSKTRDGAIGLVDFRGETIRAFKDAGWILHAETVVWKDPVTAMQRTKALGLLWKQIKKDSCMSRMGIPDAVCFFRKPGDNAERVEHTAEEFPVAQWQQWASPIWDDIEDDRPDFWLSHWKKWAERSRVEVALPEEQLRRLVGPTWMDIDQMETLQFRSVREHDDERHLCPLQTEVIRRALILYSNPGDVVFDLYGGIGSTGVVAIENGRQALVAELKYSYFQQCVANLREAVAKGQRQPTLNFDAPAGSEAAQ